jgi:hypothetical protein
MEEPSAAKSGGLANVLATRGCPLLAVSEEEPCSVPCRVLYLALSQMMLARVLSATARTASKLSLG